MKKLRQSASATARWEAERKAAAQLPLLSDIDFDKPRQLTDAATRIAHLSRSQDSLAIALKHVRFSTLAVHPVLFPGAARLSSYYFVYIRAASPLSFPFAPNGRYASVSQSSKLRAVDPSEATRALHPSLATPSRAAAVQRTLLPWRPWLAACRLPFTAQVASSVALKS